ncbi:MAG: hypothetical protein QOE09_57 [Ilumatobacteraceae bacterium]|jgi:hypothetical protein
MWLAGPVLLAACSSSPSAQTPTTTPQTPVIATATPQTTTSETTQATSPATDSPVPSSTLAPAVTLVPVDPSLLIPIALGNKPLPADADELATEHHGYTGDPNAILQSWLVMPMAVPSGPDVRLLGFQRTVGISSTTATFLTGAIDPEVALANIQAALAPSDVYTLTPSTRSEGTVTIHALDAQPTTVQGDPPGWSVEASAVDQLGVIKITRNDYAFANVVPTFNDLPPALQPGVLNQDAIAVHVGGALRSIRYEYGVDALGNSPAHRTVLNYNLPDDFTTAASKLAGILTTGWTTSDGLDAHYFTSTTTSEVWTIDDIGGFTHLTYDTGS